MESSAMSLGNGLILVMLSQCDMNLDYDNSQKMVSELLSKEEKDVTYQFPK